MAGPATDHRRETAERNTEAILDAAGSLCERGANVSFAAVAAEAGVSRVTVYAHFPTRERLLEAVAEREVQRATAEFDAAEPDAGPALDALRRLIAASWRELGRSHAVARAAAGQLSPESLRRAHESSLLALVRRLVDRGRKEGAFRADLPADWLVTSFYALVHAAADDVRAERVSSEAALNALTVSVSDLFVGPARSD